MSANIQTSFKLVKGGFTESFRKLDNAGINFMKITNINIYPIKSLHGIDLQKTFVEKRGLAFDRRWLLVDENNKFLTQRELPKMATFKVEIGEADLKVTDCENDILIPLQPLKNKKEKVQIWSSKCSAAVYDEEINNWFSDALGKKCKLVFMPEDTKRIVNPLYAVNKFEDVVSFADGYPLLIIGKGSLNDLNSRLENEIPMNRFRPNLVFDDSEPFIEDSWKTIKIGSTVFQVVKPCNRCVMTTIDQEKGISSGKEPLKTLAGYRIRKNDKKSKVLFGQYLIAENFGEQIKINDTIEVLKSKKLTRAFVK